MIKTKKTTRAPIDTATELLRDMCRGYTRHHPELRVNGSELGGMLVLSYQAHGEDHPKLVGTQGAHVRAMTTIFAQFGAKQGKAVRLTLLEPREKMPAVHIPYIADPKWTDGPILDLLRRVLNETIGDFELESAETGDGMTTISVSGKASEEFQKAIHLIFHAIGKNQGRFIAVFFCEPAAV